MALKKSKQTEYGPSAEYWRVMGFSYITPNANQAPISDTVDITKPIVNASVCLFTDETASNAGKKEFERIQVVMNVTLSATNIVKQIYDHVKTLSQFDGAEDLV